MFCMFLLLGFTVALAQDVRSLGMGSVIAPGGAAAANPAYAALPSERVSVPLPVGLLNAVTSDRFDFNGENFDVLSVLDQVTSLETFIFNPATSPDEVVVSLLRQNGLPAVSIDLSGGSGLLIGKPGSTSFRHALDLPVRFRAGPVYLGLRPYLTAGGRVTPGADFQQIFSGGSSSGSVTFTAQAEAGVSVDVTYATAVALPEEHAFPGQLYLGVRAAPFIGLARADGAGQGRIAAVSSEAGGDVDSVEYEYSGAAFVSAVAWDSPGFGLRADFGVAAVLPRPQGIITAGLSVHDLGVSFWQGEELSFATDDSDAFEPRPASRTYFGNDVGVTATAAYDLPLENPEMSTLESLLIAIDGSLQHGMFSAHLGGEASFVQEVGTIFARAGFGYDNGFVLGAGTGLQVGKIGVDAAVHSHRSPLTTNQAFGASLGLSFGF
jgi:hypothetical protein